ncbi:hypothetical protein ACHAWF_010667 [Thalassiosira exigua]
MQTPMSRNVTRTAALKVPVLPPTSPAAPQPPGIRLPLRPHQLRALHRCLLVEEDGDLSKDFGARHHYVSRGGCLADAVGMGKTATSIGLVLSSPSIRNEGDTLVVAPSHLVNQWRDEIVKFAGDDIEVLVGKREYERRATLPPEGKSRRVVVIDVETVLNEKKLWYDWRRVFSEEGGHQVHVSSEKMERYKKAALFCVKSPRGPCSYEGYVYTGPLHHPFRPWRRVIYDEIQDLVAEGTESQKNLLQLSRTAQNVWLLSATPFPHGNASVYANHELLGFCRLRLDVEVEHDLGHNHPFEVIKRKLYIRSPQHVAEDAVTASKKVSTTTIRVHPTELERKFHKLEKNTIASRDAFDEEYASLRQMMVHPEASKKLREQINGKDGDTRGGKTGRAVKQKNRTVGRFATVNSFALRSLHTAKDRYKELERTVLPMAEKEITDIRSTWYLAMKVKEVRSSAVQSNPFARQEGGAQVPLCLATEEAKAIHDYYCRCPTYGSNACESDSKVMFQTMGIDNTSPTWIKGHRSTQRVIDYLANEVKPGRKIPWMTNGSELHEYLDVFIGRKESAHKMCITKKGALLEERAELKTRIEALEETVKVGNTKGAFDDELAARVGSKTAALIRHLREVQERGERTIVFSYWHDALSLVYKSLRDRNRTEMDLKVSFCNRGGGNAMARSIAEFTSGETTVLLLSAQVKASGANLQCATNIVLLDPAGGSAEHGATLEKQAVGRAVRMGQEGAVKVVRFCTEDSIEEELFEQIDVAAAQLATRANDKIYTCEDAHKVLDAKKLMAKNKEDDEVMVGETVGAQDRLRRAIAVARAKNAIIDLCSEDEDSGDSDNDDKTVDMEGESKDVLSNIPNVVNGVNVKAEPAANCVVSAKRTIPEAGGGKAVASPEKRAKVSSTGAERPSSPKTSAVASVVEAPLRLPSTATTTYLVDPSGKLHDSLGEDLQANGAKKGESGGVTTNDVTQDSADEWTRATDAYCQSCKMNSLDQKFLKMAIELRKIKQATGKAWVSGQGKGIGQWCSRQRGEYSKFLKNGSSSLTKGRIDLLSHIGFPWRKMAEVTPRKQPTAEVGGDSTRVISPVSELTSLTPSDKSEGGMGGAGASPMEDGPGKVSPTAAGGAAKVHSQVPTSGEAQATPGKGVSDHRHGVVSPSIDGMDVSVGADELKDLLVKCGLGHCVDKFRRFQVTSAAQLLGNIQDLEFMQRLVEATGLSATEAVRLQIVASR